MQNVYHLVIDFQVSPFKNGIFKGKGIFLHIFKFEKEKEIIILTKQ